MGEEATQERKRLKSNFMPLHREMEIKKEKKTMTQIRQDSHITKIRTTVMILALKMHSELRDPANFSVTDTTNGFFQCSTKDAKLRERRRFIRWRNVATTEKVSSLHHFCTHRHTQTGTLCLMPSDSDCTKDNKNMEWKIWLELMWPVMGRPITVSWQSNETK